MSVNISKHNSKEMQLNYIQKPSSSLLQLNEFEMLNENFRRFKKKRETQNKNNEVAESYKSRQSNNLSIVKSSSNSKFGDATSEITVNAAAVQDAACKQHLSKIQKNSSHGKIIISKIRKSNSNIRFTEADERMHWATLEVNDEDEGNIVMVDYELHEDKWITVNPTLPKKIGKYRRNRNMRQAKY